MTTYTPENRITIIDNLVIIDGHSVEVDCSSLKKNIRCIQWDVKNQIGEIEFHSGEPNATLTRIDLYQTYIDQALEEVTQAKKNEAAQIAYLNSFEYQQAVLIDEINEAAEQFVNNTININARYPDFEKLTFATQQKEAVEWQADNNTPTPKLDVIAAARGIEREVLIEKVLTKTAAPESIIFQIAGQRQAKVQQAKAAKTIDELKQIRIELLNNSWLTVA